MKARATPAVHASMGTMALTKNVGLWSRAARYFRDPQVKLWRKLAGLWAVLYVASPLDVAPDVIPLVGWLDDAGVVGLVAWFLVKEIRQHTGQPPSPPPDAPR